MKKWLNSIWRSLLYLTFFFFSLISGVGVLLATDCTFDEVSYRITIASLLLRTAILFFVSRKQSRVELSFYAIPSSLLLIVCLISIFQQSPLAVVELVGLLLLVIVAIICSACASRNIDIRAKTNEICFERCPNCGSNRSENSAFCLNCGQRAKEE